MQIKHFHLIYKLKFLLTSQILNLLQFNITDHIHKSQFKQLYQPKKNINELKQKFPIKIQTKHEK
jgi:histidinol phosphatase-like PHP family hydrolase